MADDKNNSRDLVARELRTQAPKPNIIRIELLDGNARARYLGTIQAGIDKVVKRSVYETFVDKSDSVFYGFMKSQGIQGLNLSADWSDSGGSGGFLGDIRKILGAAGDGGVLDTVGSVAGGLIDIGASIEGIAKRFGGFDANLTGSTSIKAVKGVDIGDLSVSCGWYLPEQLALASGSLKILTRMVYPRQVSDEVFQEFVAGAANHVTSTQKEIDTAVHNVAFPPDDDKQEKIKVIDTMSANVGRAAATAYTDLNSLLGRNLTIDPLPVRISVGHYIDLEPLVITGIDISFSKEQWVSPGGRHLPIFCDVDIKFSSWLNPAPKLEFMQLLGTEMFGTGHQQEAVIEKIKEGRKSNAQDAKERAAKAGRDQAETKANALDTNNQGSNAAGQRAEYRATSGAGTPF